MEFLSLHKQPSVAPYCLQICNPCSCIAQVKLGERYPNRVVSFGLNRAYMEIRNSIRFLHISLNFVNIDFFIFNLPDYLTLRRSISKSLLCIRRYISFVYVMYLNIATYLYGTQIKSKLGNKLYL